MTRTTELRNGQPWPGQMINGNGAVLHYRSGEFLLQVETESREVLPELLDGKVYAGLVDAQQHRLWFVVFRLGGITFDCPFHAGLLESPEHHLLHVPENRYLGIPVVVVDSSTREMLGQRYFTVSPHFAKIIERAINNQATHPVKLSDYLGAVTDYRAEAGEPEAMLRSAIIIECGGARCPG